MLIKMHNQTQITANGSKNNGNCKPVYCITTGMVYASVADAAKDFGVHQSTISWVITGKQKTCKGHKFCLLSKVTEHFDEITKCVTKINEKAKSYDAIVEKETAKQRAYENLAHRKMLVAKAQEKLNNEMALLAQAEAEVAKYKGE